VACIYRQELARMNQQLQLEPDTSAASATGSGNGSRDKMASSSAKRRGDVTSRGRRQQPAAISGSGL